MKNFVFTRFASAVCFVVFAAYGFYQMRVNTETPKGTSDLASTSLDFETPESCGADRNYLEKDLAQISPIFRDTRKDVSANMPPRTCATYIMKNFASLTTGRSFRARCVDESGNRVSEPIRTYGKETYDDNGVKKERDVYFKAPCVSEEYVNSVYNALMDVADCFNIPAKELLPKLFNESGLHINSYAAGGDGGVGQLTRSALGDDVFEPYNDVYGKAQEDYEKEMKKKLGPNAIFDDYSKEHKRYNQQTTFEYYVQEMQKSSKPSCQRVADQKSAYTLLPVDNSKSKLCDSKYSKASADPDCYLVWAQQNRCLFISVPENPLRNVLTMAMLYRNNLKNSTGITYVAGTDMLGSQPYKAGDVFKGYFSESSGNYISRLKKLGVQNPKQEVVRQMIMSLAFNAGLGPAKNIFDEYINLAERKKFKLSNADFDFKNIETSDWAILSNFPTFFKAVSSSDDKSWKESLASLKVVAKVGVNTSEVQKSYTAIRDYVISRDRQSAKLSDDDRKKADAETSKQAENKRRDVVKYVLANAGKMTFPEYARLGQSARGSGSPGYLSFVAGRAKELDAKMGIGTCAPSQYLSF